VPLLTQGEKLRFEPFSPTPRGNPKAWPRRHSNLVSIEK